ncbi:MAG: hypothetical protein OXG36_08040 [Caldilineaceae bacterium]|nr:hypothetical protein [Caldilineaceae bacterium]
MKFLLVACWLAETTEVVMNHKAGCTMPNGLRMSKRLGRSGALAVAERMAGV